MMIIICMMIMKTGFMVLGLKQSKTCCNRGERERGGGKEPSGEVTLSLSNRVLVRT